MSENERLKVKYIRRNTHIHRGLEVGQCKFEDGGEREGELNRIVSSSAKRYLDTSSPHCFLQMITCSLGMVYRQRQTVLGRIVSAYDRKRTAEKSTRWRPGIFDFNQIIL